MGTAPASSWLMAARFRLAYLVVIDGCAGFAMLTVMARDPQGGHLLDAARVTFATAAVGFGICGYISYTRAALCCGVRPHPVSWTIWGLLTLTSLLGQGHGGAGDSVWVTWLTTFGCFTFAAWGLRSGRRDVTRLDLLLLTGALIALVVYVWSPWPLAAVILANAITVVAFVPTITKTLRDPGSESLGIYALSAAKYGCALVALPAITPLTVLWPTVGVVTELIMVAVIAASTRRQNRTTPTTGAVTVIDIAAADRRSEYADLARDLGETITGLRPARGRINPLELSTAATPVAGSPSKTGVYREVHGEH